MIGPNAKPMRLESLTDAQILEPIRHEQDREGNSDIHTVEGCILRDNNYRWYYGLGRAFKPHYIAEIGVRYGYSLYALALGAGCDPVVWCLDNNSYIPGSLDWACDHLHGVCEHVTKAEVDTQKVNRLDIRTKVDLFSVDGDHTDAGARHDMELAWPCIRPGGLLLVDDIDYCGQDGNINLRPVVQAFCQSYSTEFLWLPTTRGLAVIVKP